LRRRGNGLSRVDDGDRNAALSNANKSFADHRVTGDPPGSSPRRRAASTPILESTNHQTPYFIEHRTGFCLLGCISDVITASLAGEGERAEQSGRGTLGGTLEGRREQGKMPKELHQTREAH
jgi:hypothetical protein